MKAAEIQRSSLPFDQLEVLCLHAMALGSQPKVKRNRTGVPKGIKKRVILQFDDESPSVPTTSRLDDQRRALVAQQSLILSPPRLSTVVDNSRNDDNRARTDVASLNDKVPVGEEEVGRLVTVVGQDQHGTRLCSCFLSRSTLQSLFITPGHSCITLLVV